MSVAHRGSAWSLVWPGAGAVTVGSLSFGKVPKPEVFGPEVFCTDCTSVYDQIV